MIVGGLSTEFAVLTASSAFAIDDSTQVHLIATKVLSQTIGLRAKLQQIGFEKKRVVVPPLELAPLQDGLRYGFYGLLHDYDHLFCNSDF